MKHTTAPVSFWHLPCTLRARPGLATIWFILMLVAFSGLVSLAVDLGRVQVARSQLQTAADAAARAGVSGLRYGAAEAQRRAISVAQANTCDGQPVELDPAVDIELGIWRAIDDGADDGFDNDLEDPDDYADDDGSDMDPDLTAVHVFVPVPPTQWRLANAVRVTAVRSPARGGGIPLVWGRLLGKDAVSIRASAIALIESTTPEYGVVGLKKAKLKDQILVDSYRADVERYNAAAARAHGNVASNGNIRLEKNVRVQGDARPGRGKRVEFRGKDVTVRGSTSPLDETLSFPPVVPGEYKKLNDNGLLPGQYIHGDRFELRKGQTATLSAGTYFFKEFKVDDPSAVLKVSGPVTVIVEKKLELKKGLVNEDGLPVNLKFLVPKKGKVHLGHGGVIAAQIYAPQSTVTFHKEGTLYGSLVAWDLKIEKKVQIHVDESLPDLGVISRITLVR